jgi:drug/metabolite transporter (DMT)-like permease
MHNERLVGASLVALGAVAFSGKAIIIKLAYRHGVDPTTLLAFRMIFSAPLFLALAWWAGRGAETEPLSNRDRWTVVGLGIIGYYLSSYFDFLGLQHITAALERLVLFLNPTLVLIFSALLFKRKITRRDVVAIVLSYMGICVAFVNDLTTQPGNILLGTGWVLLSAILYAGYLIGSGRIVGRLGSARLAGYAGSVSCVAVVIHFLVTSDARLLFTQAPEVYWLSILMASAATVLPIALISEGIRRMGASHASIVASIGPIVTIFFGAIFLGEPVTAVQLLGAGLVLAGVLAISLAPKSAPR